MAIVLIIMTHKTYITRAKTSKTIEYFLKDNPVQDKSKLDYIKSLRVPPAWQNVKISVNPKSHILATGTDSAGRLQYIYNPAFRAKKEQEKFERILKFAQALPRMRRLNAKHLKRKKYDRQKVLACVVQLMDQAYFRVGNDVYAQQNQSYGLTTIRSKHVTVKGPTITFDFIGKSNKRHVKHITDKILAKVVKTLDELPGYEVFKYYDDAGNLKDVKSADVNAYIKEIMGSEFTAKDFRTWGGTLLASAELASTAPASTPRERKKTITACVKKVAKKLGNTPAIARASYIDPRLFQAYESNQDLAKIWGAVQRMKRTDYVNPDEQCVLKVLKTAA